MEILLDTKIIVALIAVFVSFVGLLISKEQKTSEFRQAWINTLRDDISNFVGQIDSVKKLVLINNTSNEEKQKETSTAMILGSVKMRELQFKISLLINPKEKDHQNLIALLETIIANIKSQTNNDEKIKELTTLSQKILKKEWNRVKDGETIFKFLKIILGIITIIGIPYLIYAIIKADKN